MVNPIGLPAPITPAKRIEEKKEETKSEGQSPPPAPADGNAGSGDLNTPTGGLDPKVAFETTQEIKNKNSSPEPKNPEANQQIQGNQGSGGSDDPKDLSDNSENGVSLDQLQGYRQDALKDMDTLNVLTDPKKMEGRQFQDKTNF